MWYPGTRYCRATWQKLKTMRQQARNNNNNNNMLRKTTVKSRSGTPLCTYSFHSCVHATMCYIGLFQLFSFVHFFFVVHGPSDGNRPYTVRILSVDHGQRVGKQRSTGPFKLK